MSKKFTGLLFAIVGSIFALNAVASSSTGGTTGGATASPKEAVDACSGKNEGDTCDFTKDNNKVSGTCQKDQEGKMACTEKK